MPKALYICYFGIREPLVRTQVIPYLQKIAEDRIDISLLTFEPHLRSWAPEQIESMRAKLAAKHIAWDCLAYHKRPSAIATAYDILAGVRFIRRKLRNESIDVLHGRVHVATLIGAVARKLSIRKPKLIFDIRGFFPEEYTDAGIWARNGMLYRVAKRVEKWLLRESDGFVVLTEKAREILFPGSKRSRVDLLGRPVEVVPCCVDIERFAMPDITTRDKMRQKLGVEGRRVLVYVGSFGGWYLSDEMFDLFSAAYRADPNIFVMILTQRQADLATTRMEDLGFAQKDFLVRTVSPSEMPEYLAAADAGVSFIKNCYSKQASSPTKNAEYLAAGLPIIANSGIGDVDENIRENGVGVLVDNFDQEAYLDAINRLGALGDIGEKCRDTAKRLFDLETVGGVRYRRLYQNLLCRDRD